MNNENVLELAIKRTSLAEERTTMAFIRTVAIFCGIYVLIKKNIKKNSTLNTIIKSFFGGICLLLIYRLYSINEITNKLYVLILGLCVALCICLLLIIL